MKNKTLSKLSKSIIAASILFGSVGLSSVAQAEPAAAGKGNCALTFSPMVNMEGWLGHPCAQPYPMPSIQSHPIVNGVEDTSITQVVTPEGQFPSVDPFANPPGSNFLMTVYENLHDFNGDEMPNTLPSTPTNPYNLHDGPVTVKAIDPRSPEDDLNRIITQIERAIQDDNNIKYSDIDMAIAILEGDKVKNRSYSGFPVLHYNGPNKVKRVKPICNDHQGRAKNDCEAGDTVVGGNLDINMIYYNQHIESDTAFIDPSDVMEVPWTITYRINILNRGMEDFSPMVMNMDRVGENVGPMHASYDASYFPMLKEGARYTIKVKQTKGKYLNLIYTWGWRLHPPRVQVAENALKKAGADGATLPEWEKKAFCQGGKSDPSCDPVNNNDDRLYAISQIGDLSPAKRMWNTFHAMRSGSIDNAQGAKDLRVAFLDWVDRTKLPTGVTADPDSDITLFYVNNTIYGSRQGLQGAGSQLGPASYKGTRNGSLLDWTKRPYNYRVTLLNGDHFPHGYMNVDFGGSRGWENQFQFTDPTTAINEDGPHTGSTIINGRQFSIDDDRIVIAGEENVLPINRGGTEEFLKSSPRADDPDNGKPQLGSGCFFTFGRNHSWPNAGGPWGGIVVPPVKADGIPSKHVVEIEYNFEPSRRLRVYQFDPLHHDVAIYSLH
ncbi:MAG: hypothetical protein AABZ18_02100 [Pseudomonadota bacterium]